jgi:hypothetical protein
MFAQLSVIFKRVWRDLLTKTIFFLLAVVLTVGFFTWSKDVESTFFVGVWLFWWLLGWSVRLVFMASLVSFILIPLSTVFGLAEFGQKMAVYTFFLMLTGVFLQIWEYFHLSKILSKYTHFEAQPTNVGFENFRNNPKPPQNYKNSTNFTSSQEFDQQSNQYFSQNFNPSPNNLNPNRDVNYNQNRNQNYNQNRIPNQPISNQTANGTASDQNYQKETYSNNYQNNQPKLNQTQIPKNFYQEISQSRNPNQSYNQVNQSNNRPPQTPNFVIPDNLN